MVLVDMLDTVLVNGPRDDAVDWDSIWWGPVEGDVRRLRSRIFKASQEGDLKRVRNLQKLMLRSFANTLVSVRRVTQRNAGRATAGIDGELALTSPDRAALAVRVHRDGLSGDARPVKRVYIPKANGRQRPLGIPVLADRVNQARVVNALEPEWEARFEPRSYGFRPGRGCHDAIEAIYWTLRGKAAKRSWVLDADLTAAFDRIDHEKLLSALGTFPAAGMIARWLTAGVIERGRFAPTDEGTPQGGVISPLLLNIALHGMEEAAGVRYLRCDPYGAHITTGSPALVRYADDLVVMCHTKADAEHAKERLQQWLTPRGLRFNEDKTRIVHVDAGFDFLGFNVRRYRGRLLIKPSPASVARYKQRLTAEVRALRGANAAMVIARLTPIVRGWAAYYRTGVSSQAFARVDNHLWACLYRWGLRSHPNKSKHWVATRYFEAFHPTRADQWVFGDRDSGRFLPRLAWTKIVRHVLVMGTASPDDPALSEYWARRRRRIMTIHGGLIAKLLIAQHWRCPACDGLLLYADTAPQTPAEWERWNRIMHKARDRGAVRVVRRRDDDPTAFALIHTHCHQRYHAGDSARKQPSQTPMGLA